MKKETKSVLNEETEFEVMHEIMVDPNVRTREKSRKQNIGAVTVRYYIEIKCIPTISNVTKIYSSNIPEGMQIQNQVFFILSSEVEP